MIHSLLNDKNQNDQGNEVDQNQQQVQSGPAPTSQNQTPFIQQPYDSSNMQPRAQAFSMQQQQQMQQQQPLPQWNQPFPPQQQQYQGQPQSFSQMHPQQQFYQGMPGQFYTPQNPGQFQPQMPQPSYIPQMPQQRQPKRRRTPVTHGRRRTMTACESCRLRKVKCDLGKPECGACTKSGLNCAYRNVKKEAEELSEKITKIVGLEKEDSKAPMWSSCNWYTKSEGVLKWPIYENKYYVPPLNSVLTENNEKGLPQISIFSKEDLNELNLKLKENVVSYIDGYLNFIQTKNPFIDSKLLLKTSDYIKNKIKEDPELDLLSLKIPDDLIPLTLILLVSAGASIARPLTFRNLEDYGTSTIERSENYELSYKFYILAEYLNCLPAFRIAKFSLNYVQYYLLEATYLMYIIKPLDAWNCIYKASTLVMTILESYKSLGKKFTETEHRLVERVFHTCVKYESELRVELSPSVPSSGIVNYPFPNVYPSPPIENISNISEESSWFYYLTEIVLRKFENRMLDDFFVPVGTAKQNGNNGEFTQDDYDLNWDKYDLEYIMKKSLGYLEDLGKIENSMISHLRSILKDDPVSGVLQPHGFLFKTTPSVQEAASGSENISITPTSGVSSSATSISAPGVVPPQSDLTSQQSPDSIKTEAIKEELGLPVTPASDTISPASSDLSQRVERIIPDVPETINFIRTRMIVLKTLLFRPLAYLLIHDKSRIYDSHPFIEQVLTQCFETIDTLNIPLACHRHFGSWFYARNTFLSGILIFALFKRVGEKYCKKSKVETLLRDILVIIDYWIDEIPDLVAQRGIILGMLDELATI